MSLLKFEMKCKSEDCGRTAIIVVDGEEEATPNICPFCGSESSEDTGDTAAE